MILLYLYFGFGIIYTLILIHKKAHCKELGISIFKNIVIHTIAVLIWPIAFIIQTIKILKLRKVMNGKVSFFKYFFYGEIF